MNSLSKLHTLAALGISMCSAAPIPRDVKNAEPLPVGTVWMGKLTQRGGGPTGFDCEFKITKRDGETFEAELHEKSDTIELTYLVRGTLIPVDAKNKEKGYKIEFKSHGAKDVMNTLEILGVPYTGTVKDQKLVGSWKLPDGSKFGNLAGDFTFEPKKAKE